MGKLFDALPDSFMKKVLDDIDSEVVEKLLTLKDKYHKVTDKEDKIIYKERYSSAFWDVYVEIAKKIGPNLSQAKRLFLRYGILDLKYLSAEDQKLVLQQKIDDKDPENSIFYVDEWLMAISQGQIKPSITDESPKKKSKDGQEVDANQAKLERMAGAVDAEKKNYQSLMERRHMLEDGLTSLVSILTNHSQDPMMDAPSVYTDDQVAKMDEIVETCRNLRTIQKQLVVTRNNLASKMDELNDLERKTGVNTSEGESVTYEVDEHTIESEVGAIRQMVKMCVGRQGNHFPILASPFLPKETRDYNFKETMTKRLLEVEGLDPSIFARTFRQNTNRILPYIILAPGYGNYGVCWEPYDKYNKATSKGRIAVPIFCRNPLISISMAMGDFRWQTAKELASYHWMDEGLTGRYYEFVTNNKVKGDIKTLFIEDYILWLTKESQGIQKLDKDSRYIFWRFVPFPDKLKEELSLKGYYYNDLYKKEMSFRMSQGY